MSKLTKQCAAGMPAGQSPGLKCYGEKWVSTIERMNLTLLANTALAICH